PAVATVTPVGLLTLVSAGTVTITASQAGDANYNAAPDVTHTITVSALSSDATLSGLALSAGTLTPAFSPTVVNYTAAVANSVSSLTVTATKNHAGASVSGAGTIPLNTGANTVTVTVTAEDGTTKTYTVTVTRSSTPVYSVSIGTFTGGSVSTDKTYATAGETVTLTVSPAANHVLNAISACRTGTPSTAVALGGTGNTRTFTMPAYGVTVTATFRNPGLEAVTAVQGLINGMTGITVDQATANTAAALKTWLAEQINRLAGMSATGITVTAADITVSGFVPAVAGTSGSPAGTNGSFTFTVSLSGGGGSVTTTAKTAVIAATEMPTGTEEVASTALSARAADGGLKVSGLIPGELLSLYNMQGQTVYKGKAIAGEQHIPLYGHGVYVVVNGNRTAKAAY
ncbi:MAG: cadherin-like beta sandwich domain-containing protein, partial [Tannerella sp.]|nr:cadherin-like beta sandwich domain-containing protein [Tannerella sp.]